MVGGQQSQLWGFVHFWVPQVTVSFNTKNGLKALDLGYLQLFQFMTDLPGTVVEFSHVAAWPNLIEGPLVIA